MYYFIGRVATLTKKENECLCTFNVETSVKINGEYIPIAYAENQKDFTRVPGSFAVENDSLFAFISQHSREKLKIGFEINTKAKANNAEDEKIGTIKEVTLQNE